MTRRAIAITLVLVSIAGIVAGIFFWREAPKQRSHKPPAPQVDSLIVVGVPGLRWSDVNRADMPALSRLVMHGSAGTLSVRSAPSVTCPAEGWLTLGSGTYSAITDPDDIDPAKGCAPRAVPPVADGKPQVPNMPEIRKLNDGLRFDAEPGLLGDSLPCTTAVGPGAALAVADKEGYLDSYSAKLPDDPERLLAKCPFTAIDAGELIGEDVKRRAEARELDDVIARVARNRPPRSVIAVVGLSETEATQARLHVAVLSGNGYSHGWLRSASTRRLPYVQLSDLAPTALSMLGEEVPASVAGRPLSGQAPGRPKSFDGTIDQLKDTDTQAVAQRSVVGLFWAGFGVISVLVLGALWWGIRRRSRDESGSSRTVRWLSLAALSLSAVPTATFLANLFPWWRSDSPVLAVSAAVVVGTVAMVTLALIIGAVTRRWNHRVGARLGVLAFLTLLVFFVDTSTGAWLQLNSMLGYNPLVAGRFVGFGNIAFSVFAVAAVFLATFLASGHRRPVAVAFVLAVALPVIAVDASPSWGADFGGVLTLVPTFVVLALLVAKVSVTWRKVTLAAGAGFVLVLLISWLDYLRPEESRSHFGRFIASILDGTAWKIIHRKMLVSMDLLFMGPHTIAAAIALGFGIFFLLRPPATLRNVYETWPAVNIAMLVSVVLAGFGFATNDSGIALPAVMSLVILPTVLALCAWHLVGDVWHTAPVSEKKPIRR